MYCNGNKIIRFQMSALPSFSVRCIRNVQGCFCLDRCVIKKLKSKPAISSDIFLYCSFFRLRKVALDPIVYEPGP